MAGPEQRRHRRSTEAPGGEPEVVRLWLLRLTNDPIREDFPAFSPDGGRIAFERFEFDDQGHVLGTGEIYVIGADGEGLTNLTNIPGSDDIRPDWAPESW